MRGRWFAVTVVAMGVALGACGNGTEDHGDLGVVTTDSHGDPDHEEVTAITTSHGSEEGWMMILLHLGVTEAEVAVLEGAISEAAPEVKYKYSPSWIDIEIAAGYEDSVGECFSWALPGVAVMYDPSGDDGQAVVDAVEQSDVVVGLEASGLETNLPAGLDGEEAFIACEPRQLLVYVAPDLERAIDGIRAEAMTVDGVVATATEGENEQFFVPDLSAYPEVESCYGPSFQQVWVVFESADVAAMDTAIARLENLPGVIGFGGLNVDVEPGDAIDELLNEDDWEKCEGVEGYVDLASDITDEQAGVVVARAAGLPGVADVDLRLVDPDSIEPCPESNDDEHYDCYVPTSSLTIYRGDPQLATPQVVSDALCDLPGVLSVNVYDHERDQEFADPYETCGTLNLTAFLADDTSRDEAATVTSAIAAIGGVSTVYGPYFADYETYEQVVVVGSLDPLVCLNDVETAPSIGLDLERMSREEAGSLADQISEIAGVKGVLGNAIGRQPWDPKICGYGGLSIQIDPEMSAGELAELFALFESRPDVQAVIHELTPPEPGHQHTQWVAVKFNTDSPPGDLDALAAEARAVPGVVEAEVWEWAWGEESEFG